MSRAANRIGGGAHYRLGQCFEWRLLPGRYDAAPTWCGWLTNGGVVTE